MWGHFDRTILGCLIFLCGHHIPKKKTEHSSVVAFSRKMTLVSYVPKANKVVNLLPQCAMSCKLILVCVISEYITVITTLYIHSNYVMLQ